MGTSRFVGHEPCPECGSENNLARYENGYAKCYSPHCNHWERPGDGGGSLARPFVDSKSSGGSHMIEHWECVALSSRGLTEETCRKFNYGVATYKGKKVQVANYVENGRIDAQKLRFRDKGMIWKGEPKEVGLFGKHLWEPGNKKLVITEGEIDAMSVAQAQGLKWPAVSVKNGAGGARDDVLNDLEYVESFSEVIIMFDMDKPGQDAAAEVASVITPGKVSIAQLPRKDANELLVNRQGKAIVDAIHAAPKYQPNDIITFSDAAERMTAEPDWGLSWPYEGLTNITYGRRRKELIFVGGGTGVGKTDHLLRLVVHNALEHGEKTGLATFEQGTSETIKRLAGALKGKAFHKPDADWTTEELEAAREEIKSRDWGALIDDNNAVDWDSLKPKIKYLVKGLGCRDIIIDHLTALTADSVDMRVEIERIVKEMAQMVQQLDCTFIVVSHLATPEGTPHEEGGRVMVRHFKGSRAIGYWAHFILGLERDQQAEDLDERRTTRIRCLKDRLTGQGAGEYIDVKFDPETGQQVEVTGESQPSENYNFEDETDDDDF